MDKVKLLWRCTLLLTLCLLVLNGCTSKTDIPDVEEADSTTTNTLTDSRYKLTEENPPIGYIPSSIDGYALIKRTAVDEDNARAEFQSEDNKLKYDIEITLFEEEDRALNKAYNEPLEKYSKDSTTTVINKVKVYKGFDKNGNYYQGWSTKFFYSVIIITVPPKGFKELEILKNDSEEFLEIIQKAISEKEKNF